ncbi:hypothetical protein WJX73_006176 [Symbiochloris irregularis]|uniref:RZ-type domain-containing protein n=1 Tax=Symbiochloris irregularis TaxID=706552 RepID=A0AAW1P1E0_9CHLO
MALLQLIHRYGADCKYSHDLSDLSARPSSTGTDAASATGAQPSHGTGSFREQGRAFYMFTRRGAPPLLNQLQMRRFVAAAAGLDSTTLLQHLGSDQYSGLDRLQEITGPAEAITCSAGTSPSKISFQHVVIPLLQLLTQPGIVASLLKHVVIPIYAVLTQQDAFLLALGRCMKELQVSARNGAPTQLSDPRVQDERNPGSIWRPSSWLDVLNPLATFLRQAIMKFRQSSTQPGMQMAVAQALSAFESWSAAASASTLPRTLLREVHSNLKAAPYLPANRPDARHHLPSDCVDRLLDTHFRLLRHDLMHPLLENVQALLTQRAAGDEKGTKHPWRLGNMPAFHDVEAVEMEFWDRSRRLGHGMLVCLWLDMAEGDPVLVFATIVKRDIKQLAHSNERLGITRATLLEAADSYFAFSPILKALQATSEASLPLSQILKYSGSSEVGTPAYLADSPFYDLSGLCKDQGTAPEVLKAVQVGGAVDEGAVQALQEHAGLDEDQAQALLAALGRELALIQGPPGTGKTYIGIKLVLSILANTQTFAPPSKPAPERLAGRAQGAGLQQGLLPDADPPAASTKPVIGPILVICFTNHALNQFLEGLLAAGVTEGLVRVGGYEKSEKLKKFNLQELTRNVTHNPRGKLIWEIKQRLRELAERAEGIKLELTRTTLIPFKALAYVIEAYDTAVHDALHWRSDFDEQWSIQGRQDALRDWLLPKKRRANHISRIITRAADTAGVDWSQQAPGPSNAQADAVNSNPFDALLLDTEEPEDPQEGPQQQAGPSQEADQKQQQQPQEEELEEGEVLVEAMQRHTLEDGELEQDEDWQDADETPDVWEMPMEERWRLYHRWSTLFHQNLTDELMDLLAEHERQSAMLKEAFGENNRDILKAAHVVGMTTTGAAQHQQLLRGLGSRIVLAEEAGEVLEAHILAALGDSHQQLILIGDHLQLRPKTQRRMRPSIADLIRSTIYPDLQDSDCVQSYPDVAGFAKNVFFLDHPHRESEEARTLSHVNKWEGDMVAAVALHLVRQGCYGPDDIAVLTPYLGQLLLLRKALERHTVVHLEEADAKLLEDLEEADTANAGNASGSDTAPGSSAQQDDQHSSLAGRHARLAEANASIKTSSLRSMLRLATVDNFQGEEAKVVIVSLVRSNKEHKAGFLNTSNRINVLLSRAMHGMILVGNRETFEAGKTTPMDPQDFDIFAGDGGCNRQCIFRLPCGHSCKRRCHPDDPSHKMVSCHENCPRILDCGHICMAECGEHPCPPCRAPPRLMQNASRTAGPTWCADTPARGGATAGRSPAQTAVTGAGSAASMRDAASPAARCARPVADHLLLAPYGELDLNSTPVVVLGCKHIFTAETLDGHLGINDVYDLDDQGRCRGLKELTPDSQAVKGCPECRAPISGVMRYGRITNKRTIDLMDSKFAAQLNLSLRRAKEALQAPAADPDRAAREGWLDIAMIHAIGSQFQAIIAQSLFLPSAKVYEACISMLARQAGLPCISEDMLPRHLLPLRRNPDNRLLIDALCGKSSAWAARQIAQSHSMYLKLANIVSDMAKLHLSMVRYLFSLKTADARHTQATQVSEQRAHELQEQALQQADGCLKDLRRMLTEGMVRDTAEAARLLGNEEQLQAELTKLQTAHSSNITPEEKRMVYQAMGHIGQGYTGRGHWYQCRNCGSAYVVGDCGGHQQEATCPECGGRIGGLNYRSADPVASQFLTDVGAAQRSYGYDNRRADLQQFM